MKQFLITLIFTSTFCCFAQTKEDAQRDAEITAKATLNMDFRTVLKHTLPSVVDLMGGEDTALGFIKSMFDDMKTQGFVFEKADVVNISDIVEEQGQYRCFVENLNVMKMSDQRITSQSFLLGIYNDQDQHWWFIEAKQLKSDDIIDEILPNFKTGLQIPDDNIKMEPINN